MRSPPSRAARPLPLSQSPRRLKSQPQQLPPSDSRGDAPTPPASPVKPDVRSGTKESSSPETEVTIREPLAFSPDTHISRESIPSQRPVSSPHEIRRERTEPSIGSPRTHRVTRSRTHDLVITQEHSVVSDSRSPREPSMPGVPPDMPLVCVDRYRKYDRYWYSAPRGSEGDSRTQRWVEENALAAREHVETPREPAPLPPNVTVRSPVRVRRERTEPTITSSPRVAQGNVSSKPSSTTVLAARGDDRPRLETSHLGADRTMNTENLPESVSTYRGARGSPVPSAALGSTQASHETPDDFSHTPFTRAHRESGPGSRVSRTSSDPTARGSSGRGADVVERTYSEPNLPPAQGSPARRRVPGGTVPGTPQRIGRPGSFVSTQNEAAALPLPLSPLHGLNLSPPLQHVASEDLDPRSPHSGALVPSR
ncbi:hypothetical protein OBBRIDRAFT_788580 [Obba rivulosa]|uniref:Uncharacterized protein n=1 Tax=Obba rivulosa TaxID=1052685 RepID=A0A8E2DSR7_9APHY|nr:hypothetical protein OBBRIDRAFT_788580 [Obba rivulosa]